MIDAVASGAVQERALSPAIFPLEASRSSTTQRTTSAVAIARRARFTPSASTASVVSRKPAVSTTRTGMPSRSKSAFNVSRVVPGTFVTMARSSPDSRFNKLDFPTFGPPAMTTFKPSCRSAPWRASARKAERCFCAASSLSPTSDSERKSISSSGKSMALSQNTRISRSCCAIACTRFENSPASERSAPRAAWRVALLTRSRTASAWAKSIFPLTKAHCVNSPGPARRAPRDSTRSSSMSSTIGPPCPCNSSTSSPVNECGPSNRIAMP